MEVVLNRRVDELTQEDISSLKREPRKRYRNIVNRICRIDDRAFQNRGRCELGASERIIDRIKKGDTAYLQNINDILVKSKDIVLNSELYRNWEIDGEDLKIIKLDMLLANTFLTSLHTMQAGEFVSKPEVNLDKITYKADEIRRELVYDRQILEIKKAFAEIKESGLLDLVQGVFKLIQERDLEELKRRTDILEDYFRKIGIWEDIFKPTYRHLGKVEMVSTPMITGYEVDLVHLVYCTQMMLIATHPSYDRVLRNRNDQQVNKMSW